MFLAVVHDAGQPHSNDGRRAATNLLQAAAQCRPDLGWVAHVLPVGTGRLRLPGEIQGRVEVAAPGVSGRGEPLRVKDLCRAGPRPVAAVVGDTVAERR